jgi:hypothetical protein
LCDDRGGPVGGQSRGSHDLVAGPRLGVRDRRFPRSGEAVVPHGAEREPSVGAPYYSWRVRQEVDRPPMWFWSMWDTARRSTKTDALRQPTEERCPRGIPSFPGRAFLVVRRRSPRSRRDGRALRLDDEPVAGTGVEHCDRKHHPMVRTWCDSESAVLPHRRFWRRASGARPTRSACTRPTPASSFPASPLRFPAATTRRVPAGARHCAFDHNPSESRRTPTRSKTSASTLCVVR